MRGAVALASVPAMIRGLWKIGIGLTLIVCGLKGELVVRTTDWSWPVALLGVVSLVWGIVRVVSVVRADMDESTRSRNAISRGSRARRNSPSWMAPRRRR